MYAFLLIAIVTIGSHQPVKFRHTSVQRFGDFEKCLDAGALAGDKILRRFDKTKFKIKTFASCEKQITRET